MRAPNIITFIVNKIAEQLNAIKSSDTAFFGPYSIVVTNEQQYVKVANAQPKTIYVVVKFLQGTKDFGQQRQPYSISAMGEQNSIAVCQRLMMEFAETYNLQPTASVAATAEYYGFTWRQTVSTVAASGNFSEVYNGFRSLFYLTGTFLIGINGNPIRKIEVSTDNGTTYGEINFISAQMSYTATQDSQPFYGTNNFCRTVNKTAAFSLGFTMYADESAFFKSVLDIVFNVSGTDIDKMYKIRVYPQSKDGAVSPAVKYYEVDMRLVSVSEVQEARDFPAVSITLAR